jgi:hypothetical protein
VAPRRPFILAAQIAFAILVIALAANQLAPAWPDVVAAWGRVTPRWGYIAASCGIVLASYALLIAVWRGMLSAWGSDLPAFVATRIWFVSNLGKYVPGKVWQIVAMGAMSQQAGVPAAAAVGASLLIAVINILAGVAVILVTGADALSLPPVAAVGLAIAAVSVVMMPSLLPRMVRWVGTLAGRDLTMPPLRFAVIAQTFAGCAIAWMLYGWAFQLLALGTIPDAGGATRHYIALFTSSYIAGYVTPWAPGGLLVREGALVAQMDLYGLTTASGAFVLSLVSRVWLTVLELLPGLFFLATVPRTPIAKSHDA